MENKAQLTGHERSFENDGLIVSKTDLTGKILYGNRLFYEIADLSEEECKGVQHNIVRHPEMPRVVFDKLWKTVSNKEEIFAYVVNRAKNGDHYWVLAHVTPSFDARGGMDGYHSNRRVPNKSVISNDIVPLYRKLSEIEANCESPKEGLERSNAFLDDMLKKNNKGFNEFIFSLGV